MTPFATYIIETLATLVAVVALAVVFLAGARRFGVGRATGPLELVGRLPLEARRTVYLVRVLDRVFVLGSSEAGLEKLAELEGSNLLPAEEPQLSFRQALSRALQRDRQRVGHESLPSSRGGSTNAGK